MIYVKENIPARVLDTHELPDDIESIFLELNFRRNKWLLMGTYHPPSQSTDYYYMEVGKALDVYRNTYDNLLLIGDFNEKESDSNTLNLWKIII